MVDRFAVIRKEKGKYCVKSPKNPDWNGGCFDSEGEAARRLEQVEWFKHKSATTEERVAQRTEKMSFSANSVVARFQKSAASIDAHGEWRDIITKHAKAEQADMDDLVKKLVPYLRSVGYDLEVAKSYLGKEEHGSDGFRRRGALIITEREENTAKASSPQKVAMWVEQATGMHGSARHIDGDTWLVDIDED